MAAHPPAARSLFDDLKTGTRSRVPQAFVKSSTTPNADQPRIAVERLPKPTRMKRRIKT
jgi:hypothetical protein